MPKHPPSFDLFVSDFRDGCRYLDLDAIGAYVLLLLEQFERGVVPKDLSKLAKICQRCDEATFQRIWEPLQDKFDETDDAFVNPKMAEVREKTFRRWSANRENAVKRWNNRSDMPPHKPSDMPPHKQRQCDVEAGSRRSEVDVEGGRGSWTPDVEAVVSHYRSYHPKARPGEKERKLIVQRLKDGFSQDELKQAIDGCHVSPFHCGENDTGAKHQKLSLILRDNDQVTKFIECLESSAEPVLSAKTKFGQRAADSFLAKFGGDDASD